MANASGVPFSDEVFFDDEAGWDPLEDAGEEEWDDDDRAERFGYVGDPAQLAAHSEVPEEAPKSPQERMDALLGDMPSYRMALLEIVSFCEQPQDGEAIEGRIAELIPQRKSVYTAASFCRMLADAGMLEKVDADGYLYEEEQIQPEEYIDEEGNARIRPTTPPAAFWRTTDEGLAYLVGHEASDSLRAVIEENARYKPVFKHILQLCAHQDGASISTIISEVKGDPLLADPPKMPQFFMDYLERGGAICWNAAWKATDLGKEALAWLDEELGD